MTAHSCTRKCDNFSRASVQQTEIGEKPYLSYMDGFCPLVNFVGVGRVLVHMERVLYSSTYVVSSTFRVVLEDTSRDLAKAPQNAAVKSPRAGRCHCGRARFDHRVYRSKGDTMPVPAKCSFTKVMTVPMPKDT